MIDKDSEIGKIYTYLKVLEKDVERTKKERERFKRGEIKRAPLYYKCECECGNIITVRINSLRTGNTTNCGCVRKEKSKTYRYAKKYNKYDLESQNYGIGFTHRKEEFWFDLEDYDKIKEHSWSLVKGYPYTNIENKCVPLHRVIMDLKSDDTRVVDHINHNTYDNRKQNLRICTQNENHYNMKISKYNKSGVIGVCWSKKERIWRVYITYKRKRINIGGYADKDYAIKKRLQAELQYFGEFAPQQHLFTQYGVPLPKPKEQ